MDVPRLSILLVLLLPAELLAQAPPCKSLTPFAAPDATGQWNRIATPIGTISRGRPAHRVQDGVVAQGRPQRLQGKFAYGRTDKDLKREDVQVFVLDRPPCGRWRLLGGVRTSDDGEYGVQFGVKDDGGRAFFTVPQRRRLPVGRHPVAMAVRGDATSAEARLWVLRPGTEAVVFDIDGTLTRGDDEIFRQIARHGYDPTPRRGSVAVARAYAEKGFLVVYITGRPDLLKRVSVAWLKKHGFPPGPVHLTDSLRQALPSAKRVGRYKLRYLERLIREGGVRIVAAYGNAATDIQAYAAAGVDTRRTFICGPKAGQGGTADFSGYRHHLRWVIGRGRARVPAPLPLHW